MRITIFYIHIITNCRFLFSHQYNRLLVAIMNTWSDAIMSSSLYVSNIELAKSRDKKYPMINDNMTWQLRTWKSKSNETIVVCLGFNYKPKSNSSQSLVSTILHCNGTGGSSTNTKLSGAKTSSLCFYYI